MLVKKEQITHMVQLQLVVIMVEVLVSHLNHIYTVEVAVVPHTLLLKVDY
jgi:hypothetical protein